MSESTSCCPLGSHQAPALSNDAAEVEPKGSLLELGPTKTPCYYSFSTAGNTKSNVEIVVYTDVWGYKSRIRTLIDHLADHGGFHVIALDCFCGETRGDHVDDFVCWICETPYNPVVAQDTQTCVDYLRKQGVTVFRTVSFCWGAWAIGKSLAGFPWRSAVVLHPSFFIKKMAFDGNNVKVMKGILCPLLLLLAKNDSDYLRPSRPAVEEIVKRGGKSILFRDMVHGWTTRDDMKEKNVEQDVNKAMRETLDFLRTNLKK